MRTGTMGRFALCPVVAFLREGGGGRDGTCRVYLLECSPVRGRVPRWNLSFFPTGKMVLYFVLLYLQRSVNLCPILTPLEINSFLLQFVILKISPCPFSQIFQVPSEIPYLT